ncbi:MAG: apolipoprotein N-acyltransferase, partial [Paracoccaceae bacterium]|nr:apolipoprotein N-acyltransferase [Paracoccaceae bacterium]
MIAVAANARNPRAGWPGWSAVAAASGLGAVMALGQAPLGFWWLSLPALAGLIALVARASGARGAGWLALFGGAGHFALALSWLVEPFLIDVARYGWMAPFAVVFMAFGLALFWAGAAMLAHWGSGLRAKAGGRRALLFGVTLAVAELARGYVLTGFPWALIGHVWIDTPLSQVAALIGPGGLTLMTTLAASLPVAGRWRGFAGAAGVLAAAAGFGVAQLGVAVAVQPDPVIIRLVQPNAEQHLKWDADRAITFFNRLLVLTETAPAP